MERALAKSRGRQLDGGTQSHPIRLMIVDDSTVARSVLSRMVESDPAFHLVAVAGSAEEAVDLLSHCRVDVVILDLEMPGAGGLKSIPRILAVGGGAKVLVVSSVAEEGAEQTVAALALGATDTMPKPGLGRFNGKFSEILLSKIKVLGHAETGSSAGYASRPMVGEPALRPMGSDPIQVLAIGASTGGIHAFGTLFQALPRRIGVPILITQHLPGAFLGVFARQLGMIAHRKADVAEDGMPLLPDHILVAPGDAHLTLEPDRDGAIVRLTQGRASSGCLPSLDPMFASAASIYGSGALGIVLTGMGRDGVSGATTMIACGGSVIAQDKASSAVYGMPRAIAEAGLASALLPPDKIAQLIASRTAEQRACR